MRSGSGSAAPRCWRCWSSSRPWRCPPRCSSPSCPCCSPGTTLSARPPAPIPERSTSRWPCWRTGPKVRQGWGDGAGPPPGPLGWGGVDPSPTAPSPPPIRRAGPPTLWGLLHVAEPAQDWRPRSLLHQGVSEHLGGAHERGTGSRRASVQPGWTEHHTDGPRMDGRAGCMGQGGEALLERVSRSRQALLNPTRTGHPVKPPHNSG